MMYVIWQRPKGSEGSQFFGTEEADSPEEALALALEGHAFREFTEFGVDNGNGVTEIARAYTEGPVAEVDLEALRVTAQGDRLAGGNYGPRRRLLKNLGVVDSTPDIFQFALDRVKTIQEVKTLHEGYGRLVADALAFALRTIMNGQGEMTRYEICERLTGDATLHQIRTVVYNDMRQAKRQADKLRATVDRLWHRQCKWHCSDCTEDSVCTECYEDGPHVHIHTTKVTWNDAEVKVEKS